MLSPALKLVPTVPVVKTDKGDLYVFPLLKMLAVPWDRGEQTGLLQNHGLWLPPCGAACGASSQVPLMSQGCGASNRNILTQVWSPSPSEVLSG